MPALNGVTDFKPISLEIDQVPNWLDQEQSLGLKDQLEFLQNDVMRGTVTNLASANDNNNFNASSSENEEGKVHFKMLWRILQERDKDKFVSTGSLELVVIQVAMLSLLITVAVMWAFCCRRKCSQRYQNDNIATQVAAFVRKISTVSYSKDLPPSYSRVDLSGVGLSVDDHLNPPPTYEAYIAERKKRPLRISTISSITWDGTVITGNDRDRQRSHSRVTFSENLTEQLRPPAHRELSVMSLPVNVPSILVSPNRSRKRSVNSEGSSSRKVSLDMLFGNNPNYSILKEDQTDKMNETSTSNETKENRNEQ